MVKPVLWIVIPCYNEESVIPITAPVFLNKLDELETDGKISTNSKVLFVDDGSSDSTWHIIKELSETDDHYLGIRQSRNRGHQNAVLAGLMEAKDKCDITVSIDCDGQDDINAINEMVDRYLEGFEVVYGVRSNRDSDTWFKRFTAEAYYKLLNSMGAEVIFNHADYRLISADVLQHLAEFEEVNLFLRGLVPLVGFNSTTVSYERKKRVAGESHYPIGKMLVLAFDGITSLTIKPIAIITGLGLGFSATGFVLMLWAIIGAFRGSTIAGWASTICIICLLGGIQLLSLGIIGQYISKTYMETKRRPRFIISERTWVRKKRQWKNEKID